MKLYPLSTALLLALTLLFSACDSSKQELSYCDYVEVAEDGTSSMTLEDFCQFSDCYWNTTDFEAQFETCEELEWDYHRCWKRFEGCGVIQYEQAHDESFYYMVSYNAENGLLMGAITGNDFEPYCNGASQKEDIGYVGPNLTRNLDNSCAIIQETYCCNAD